MSRRDTIIISVLVNAALLVVLFVTAVTSKSKMPGETKISTSASFDETTIDAKELFSETSAKDTVATKELISKEEQNEFVPLMEKKEVSEKKENVLLKEEEKIVYKLPEIVKNTEEQKKESLSSIKTFEIKVKKGDTLEKIAIANKVKISEILKLNNLSSSSLLKIGQVLSIPQKDKKDIVTKIEQPKEKIKIEKPKSLPEYYTVKVGDNPYTIAIKHNIKLSELLKLNNLDEKKARKLKPGNKLRIR